MLCVLPGLDCLLSLALTATQPGFTRPTFTDEHQLSIEGGTSKAFSQSLLDDIDG